MRLPLLAALVILTALAGGAFYACRQRQPQPLTTPVILISIDTLRARNLGCYGYDQPTSKAIDALARDAILFEDAFAPEPHTLPSHVSLLTGTWPRSHGVLALQGHPLSAAIPTLAEVLKQSGYATMAFANGGFLLPDTGIDHGFDGYDFFASQNPNAANRASRHGRSAEETNVKVVQWLDARADQNQPFFLFLHYFDVHSDLDHLPYDSPPEYQQRFCAWYHGSFASDPAKSYASSYFAELNTVLEALPPDDLRYVKSLYDAGIAYTDDQLAVLFAALKQRGLYDRSVIVLVADHGEEFQEHEHLMHTQLFDECVHVPAIIKLPLSAHAGTRVKGLVSLTDVMPTVLGYLGVDAPLTVQGQNRLPLAHGQGQPAEQVLLSYHLNGAIGMRDARYKLISSERDKLSNVRLLFGLENDPLEKHDLGKSEAQVALKLHEKLLALRNALLPLWGDKPLEIDLEKFRELGYPGGSKQKPPTTHDPSPPGGPAKNGSGEGK